MKIVLPSNISGIKIRDQLKALGLSSLLGLGILFFLVWLDAANSFRLGEQYLQAKEYQKAVLAFEQTVLTRVPWSPFQDRAVGYLVTIGDLAQAEGNTALALQAYHAILFSKASLSVYRNSSQEDSLLAMDQLKKINSEWIGPKIPENFPKRLWSLAMGLSLLFWIFSILLLIKTGFDKDGKMRKPVAYYSFGLFVFTFSLWLTSLINL